MPLLFWEQVAILSEYRSMNLHAKQGSFAFGQSTIITTGFVCPIVAFIACCLIELLIKDIFCHFMPYKFKNKREIFFFSFTFFFKSDCIST